MADTIFGYTGLMLVYGGSDDKSPTTDAICFNGSASNTLAGRTRSPAIAGMADSWRQINVGLLGGKGKNKCPMASMISISQA